MKRNVVLIGMKHCGKSTVGRALGERWHCQFNDVDAMIEALHTCDTDERISVRTIVDRRGEDYFHDLEGMVVCDLYMKLQRPEVHMVIALGGRTALNESVRKLIDGLGVRVYLEVSEDEVWRRVQSTGIPPWLDQDDPAADFRRLYSQREPQYRTSADITIQADGLTSAQIVDQIEKQLTATEA